jgi:hypothetical protein
LDSEARTAPAGGGAPRALIEFRDLHKSFGDKQVLRGVTCR